MVTPVSSGHTFPGLHILMDLVETAFFLYLSVIVLKQF